VNRLSKGKQNMFARTIKVAAVAAVIGIFATSAMAQHRHNHNSRHHAPRHYHSHQHINPYAVVLGFGMLGAGIAAYQYQQYRAERCWQQLVGYDYRGRPVYQLVCE
jgi:CxxC motif-containing protein (DUF1111 family)